jgi:hypothetical protein
MKGATDFAVRAGTRLARTGYDVIQWKSALSGAARQPIASAKRALRRGRFAAEDCVDEFALAVRKHPVKSAGLIFGAAFGVGVVAGWLAKRR